MSPLTHPGAGPGVLPAVLRVAGRPLPVVNTARIYACGVTPYDLTHLGHAATFVWVDVVVRVLRWLGTGAELCRNVTDVDDVLLAAARRAGVPYDSFAAVQQFSFDHDMAALGVGRPTYEPRARLFVRQVVQLAAALVRSGQAYERGGSVYFRGEAVAERAGVGHEDALRRAGEYGDHPGDPAKDHPLDVVLWQTSSDGEPAWPSPWGAGRPGWHAECAAMALSTFGPAVDLLAGGADLVFPHHAYQAAQAEAATGVRPFARSAMHVGTVRVDGCKMAKSAGNLVLVGDLLAGHPPALVRMLLLDRPWSAPWDYHPGLLTAAGDRLEALYVAAGRRGDSGTGRVRDAICDDLNVPTAVDAALDVRGGQAARQLLALLGLQ